jgi:riboflavin synthase
MTIRLYITSSLIDGEKMSEATLDGFVKSTGGNLAPIQNEEPSMFTGIITDIGHVHALEKRGDLRARIGTSYDTSGIDLGASIASDGVCLTVVELGPDWYDVEISAETLSKTNVGEWVEGQRVNLERALKVGDELGGHIVSGHVDGVAELIAMHDEGDSTRFTFRAPENLAKFIAPKGSVALNGTSLTVNEVDGCDFGINIIPHTKEVTIWGQAKVGDAINLEIDTLARYVARLAEMER